MKDPRIESWKTESLIGLQELLEIYKNRERDLVYYSDEYFEMYWIRRDWLEEEIQNRLRE